MVSKIQSISDKGFSNAFIHLQQKQQQLVQVNSMSSILSSLAKVVSNLSWIIYG